MGGQISRKSHSLSEKKAREHEDIYSSRVVTDVPANKHKALRRVMGTQTRTIYRNFLFKRKE